MDIDDFRAGHGSYPLLAPPGAQSCFCHTRTIEFAVTEVEPIPRVVGEKEASSKGRLFRVTGDLPSAFDGRCYAGWNLGIDTPGATSSNMTFTGMSTLMSSLLIPTRFEMKRGPSSS